MSFEQKVLPPFSPLKSAGFPVLSGASKQISKIKVKVKGMQYFLLQLAE